MRKTIIEVATGNVVNVIILAEGAEWSPPEGQVIGPDGGNVGDTWDGKNYIPPPQPTPIIIEGL